MDLSAAWGEKSQLLAALATRQHGVVSTRQLGELGYGRNAVHKAAGVGRLHRVQRGVYAVGHRRLTWEGRCMAAVLASYPSVAGHLSAAWLWGLLRSRPETIHVTCRVPRRGKRPFVLHRADLAQIDLARRDGIPVTSLSRTILDVAVTSRLRTVTRHIRIANDEKLFELREMEDLLERTKGHRGRPRSARRWTSTRRTRRSPARGSRRGSSRSCGKPGSRSPR